MRLENEAPAPGTNFRGTGQEEHDDAQTASPDGILADTDVVSTLRAELEATGKPLSHVTVLAAQNDPYRIDTPARHRDAAWLAEALDDFGLGERKIHLRGIHYRLIGRTKPNGLPYKNTDNDWLWMSGGVAAAARWLRYVPFDAIVDERNDEPVVRVGRVPCVGFGNVSSSFHLDIDEYAYFEPMPVLGGFSATQPYRIVLFGEKSSLAEVLEPVANKYEADLFLPTGEISVTQVHTMARHAADDGRPMVVVCVSDCDPSGWQMPISIGRKLQAFKTMLFPDLEFDVVRGGLTPDQVREHDFPSSPLKEKEKRADKWRDAMGVEQIEVDAILALDPSLLQGFVDDAIAPYYDRTLRPRVGQAEHAWRTDAQRVLDEALPPEDREQMRAHVDAEVERMRHKVTEIKDLVAVDQSDFDLPPAPELPVPQLPDDTYRTPLLDSRWSFTEQCERLIASRQYESGDR